MSPLAQAAASGGEDIVHVVCAWPVSGQYGPGTRILYYVLVAACIIFREKIWLRNAALAVALVFPAVAALHGLVLAALHTNGAIDMDVYGVFQQCSIGILAAPTTVRLSKTYKDAPGRNTIFAWTGLIVAGLLSLIVEFYRATPKPCYDEQGNPVSEANFVYGKTMCGLTCSEEEGPTSPMRGGAASNIYVIPIPVRLTFNTALVIAAACCIPAILSIALTWYQILESNYKKRNPNQLNEDEPIAGTNGATKKFMREVNSDIRKYQNYIEVPLFVSAVLAILIIGELNFFSAEVRYQTEPIATIGQWAPIAGTVLATIGSLYLVLAGEIEAKEQEGQHDDGVHPVHSHDNETITSRRTPDISISHLVNTINSLSDIAGSALHKKTDDSGFKRGLARDFPIVPGEEHRVSNLPQIMETYNPTRGDSTSELRRSRSASFTSQISVPPVQGAEASPSLPPSPGTPGSPGSPMEAPRRLTLEVPPKAHH